MQKEINNAVQSDLQSETSLDRATPETQPEPSGGSDEPLQEVLPTGEPEPSADTVCAEDQQQRFEELIKGPYKEAFAAKVQGIINKRFKEEKTKEAKNNSTKPSDSVPPKVDGNTAEQATVPLPPAEPAGEENATLQALLEAGVDAETAYQVLHFDEMMDASVRYGASMAAKQLADSIRLKGTRPAENGTKSQNGFAPHRGAAGLTPQKRRELAQKALMGQHIGF